MDIKITEEDLEFVNKIKLQYNLSDHLAIKNEEWIFLYKTILNNNFKTILEIGSYYHFSSVAILEAIGETGILLSLDIRFPNPEFYHPNKNWIRLEQSSHDILPKLKNKFDLILIDGDHSTNAAKIDIENSLNLINDNGIILIHDSNYSGPKQAIEQVLGDKVQYWSVANTKFHGFGIYKHEIKK